MDRHIAKHFVFVGIILVLGLVCLPGCGGEPAAEPVEPEEEVEATAEAKTYAGSFKFAGEAVLGVEGSNIILDPSVTDCEECGNFTDIVVTENLTDFDGNVFTPGTYEFQFVEFPEEQGYGSYYVYINYESSDAISISGNPKNTDSGSEYELKEGDIVSVDFWTIATFYKVVK